MKKNDYDILHWTIRQHTFPTFIFCSWIILLGVVILEAVTGNYDEAASAAELSVWYIAITILLTILLLHYSSWKIKKLLENE